MARPTNCADRSGRAFDEVVERGRKNADDARLRIRSAGDPPQRGFAWRKKTGSGGGPDTEAACQIPSDTTWGVGASAGRCEEDRTGAVLRDAEQHDVDA